MLVHAQYVTTGRKNEAFPSLKGPLLVMSQFW